MKTINQKKYQKYINELLNKNEKKLSLFCHQDGNNSIIIEGKRIKFGGALFVYSRGDFQICFGKFGEENFSYTSEKVYKNQLYIIVDQKSNEKKRLHVNFNNEYVTHSDKDIYEEREFILTYVETQKFAQLQVYDSFLKDNKFGEFFADTFSTITSARCLALGQLVNVIPDITTEIPSLYESAVEDEA
ncbi:hypothetical protein P4605_10010 [Priestia aryabhattai]|uniref:hypothetical protein n=1 Tax=Priestia aryabhattai TaxID=412384 RepID=UPI002E1A9EFE|nr:hypothetical protein [Priestia aryabhattai]